MSETNMAWQHQPDCPKPTTVDGVYTCDCAWRWREQHPVAHDQLSELQGMLATIRKAKPAARAVARTTLVNALADPLATLERAAAASLDAHDRAVASEAHSIIISLFELVERA